ncbi:ROK family protein [Cohnella thermotolerans]|uniref:ROK family protein n=1 Tax=Cohnella thermotolerans TaxID=329858 RepID=UPI00041F98A4|nr:ROK family protein [Cohnella thermotolerans]
MEWAIGVDLGGTKMQFAAIDRQGRIGHRHRVPTNAKAGPQQVMDRMLEGIGRMMAAVGPGESVVGIGIGSAGQIDWRNGEVVYAGDTLPGWTGTPIRRLAEERFGKRTHVDNDVNAAAVAEKLYGAGRECDSFVCLTLGTGIGGAVFEGGRLVRGAYGGAGELGHVPVDFNGPRCGCGNNGCIELYASGPGIARLGLEALEAADARDRPAWEPTAGDIVRAWLAGDAAAARVMDTALRALGAAVAGYIHAFNPQAVVIGGGVPEAAGPAFLEALNREVRSRTTPGMSGACRIRAASLGADAGVVGAGALVWDCGESRQEHWR